MIKLPVRVNIPASLPVAPTLPSLAYKNSGTKQAPHPLQVRPVLWASQREGPQAGQQGLLEPQSLLLLGGRTLSGLHPFPKSRQNREGEGPGPEQGWEVWAEEVFKCSSPFFSKKPARKTVRRHIQNSRFKNLPISFLGYRPWSELDLSALSSQPVRGW